MQLLIIKLSVLTIDAPWQLVAKHPKLIAALGYYKLPFYKT